MVASQVPARIMLVRSDGLRTIGWIKRTMNEVPQVQLLLNPNGVSSPVQRVVTVSSQVVAFTLKALTDGELKQLALKGPVFGFLFNEAGGSDEERLQTFRNWILVKGFQELARGVRETLEEAVLYLEIANMGTIKTTMAEFESRVADIRKRVGKLNFKDLMVLVNAGLSEKMTFSDEFMSLQKVRNCLEHRAGRVGHPDIDANSSKMVLNFPRFRVFYKRGDEEVEVTIGETIDTHDIDEDGNVQIYLQQVTSTLEYALGEQVVITETHFGEISMSCVLFATDLVSKLPKLPPIDG